MGQSPNTNTPNLKQILATAPWGLRGLLGFVAVLCYVVWFARAHYTTIPGALVLTLTCFSFAWTFLSVWQVHRGGRKLGWDRSHYAQFLASPAIDDPDLFFLCRWTLQLCYAALAVVLCMLAIAFAG